LWHTPAFCSRSYNLAWAALTGILRVLESGEAHDRAGLLTGMTHIAIQEKLDGNTVDWMEHVTDEQYQP